MDSGTTHNKKPNPRQTANPLSAVTFFYTLPLFFEGRKKELEVTDLYETWSVHKSSKLGDKIEAVWNKELENAKQTNKTPSLRKVILKTFGTEFIINGFVIAFVELVIKIAQPLALGELIMYFTPTEERTITKTGAYLYAGAVVGCSLAAVLINHPYIISILHIGMKIRIACCSLIYRKALRLNKTALGQTTTVGQVVNLLANDVSRFEMASVFVQWIWLAPLQTVLVTYFMYEEIGISAVLGVVALLLFVPLQFFLGSLISKFRLKTAIRTDERVRLMNEVISGIQVIKMYTWEKPFAKLVSIARSNEISKIRGVSYIRGVFSSFILFTTRLALFVSILSYVLFDNVLTARQVFAVTAFYNCLRASMTNFFPQAIAALAETNVSVKRLNTFMLREEKQTTPAVKASENGNGLIVDEKSELTKKDTAITMKEAVAKWSDASSENTFTNINLNIKRGSLVAVIGPVGSGKTSLLHAILKELPLLAGTLDVQGRVSYASQEPWLFSGSIRQNILFGNEMDKYRYKNVVSKCALERDFTLFPSGDKTIVGERGISLSGGQRARINLARTVYTDADIYLLDDPLSAVDTHVGKQLFEECIQDFLFGKTVILITHQLQYLKAVDHIIMLEDGIIKAEGNFEELQESGLDFAKLLKSETEENKNEDSENKKRSSLQQQASVMSTTSVEEAPAPAEVQEQRSSGAVAGFVYMSYIRAGGNWCLLFLFLVLLVIAQVIVSIADYFITFWVNLEQERSQDESSRFIGNNKFSSITDHDNIYGDFRNSLRKDGDFWDFSRETCIYIYSGLTAGIIVLAITRSMAFYTLCMKASKKLHNLMFESMIRGTMRFFNTNTSGRILNRFSKDIGAVDERLPFTMLDVLQIGLVLVGTVAVISTVDPWLLLPTVVILVIFYFLRVFYLKTSREVKRLEGITRSPVFAHLNASLQGLTTIRAFGAEAILEREFDKHQDLHSSSFYSFIAASTAFGYVLDLICVIYIGIVTFSFLVIGEEQYGGNVGLAITQSMGLTGMFQWGMRQTTELENLMTSVERVLEYTAIEHEPPIESPPDKKPPDTWPNKGEVTFEKLHLHYFLDDPPILKNLNFTIKPLEKVGIVGRTGAGKSSLISALFLLTDTKGSVIIDGIDTKEIGLHDLRSKISIIPQEPVLFSGTMRKNLDPFDEYDDEVLWKALEEVELKEVVAELSGGLNSKMSEGGSNFSVGQRQLICLARAIIRNNKILVLDEATANVDPQTDALIQHTIRRKFENCTVLTIAHRLHTIMDSDKVLVMDAGTMVELDHPHVLLQNEKGYFYSMVQQTGKAMADVLARIAKEKYEKSESHVEPSNE